MFGPDQDNYIKLVAIAQSGGTLGLQFYSENKGVGTTIGPTVPISSPSTLQSLELRLLPDPQAGTVQAAYRAIYPTSDTGLVILPNSVALKGVSSVTTLMLKAMQASLPPVKMQRPSM